jgi:hypothetical protein
MVYQMPFIVSRWGADCAAAMLDWIEDFDGRVRAAAKQMASGVLI